MENEIETQYSHPDWISEDDWEYLSEKSKRMIRNGATEQQMKFRWAEEKYSATVQYSSGCGERFQQMLDKAYQKVCTAYKAWKPESEYFPEKYH